MLPNFVNKIEYNNNDVLLDWISGIFYTRIERRKLTFENQKDDIIGTHGRIISPTYARARVITIEGVIDWLDNSRLRQAIQHLEQMFKLQSDLSELQRNKLKITDYWWDEWSLDVTVTEPIEIIEYSDDFIWASYKRRTVLESIDNPIYRSLNENVYYAIEWTYGGISTPISSPFSWSSYGNTIDLTTNGNTSTPLHIEITATVNLLGPVRILNITNWQIFGVSNNMSAWDKLIIDSATKQATLNELSVIANRIAGSEWLFLEWTQTFVVLDGDGITPNNWLSIKFTFNNQLA